MSVNSCRGVSPGWTPSSAGGNLKISQPPVGRGPRRNPAEPVAQCLAQPLSLARVEEHVRADDRHAVMLRLECGISPRVRTFAVTGRSSSLEPASLEGHSRTLAQGTAYAFAGRNEDGGEMAEVLLFHHAQGQTDGFAAFAEDLRRAGHTVHTPDLFQGRTFDSIDEGMA